jgi:hypothetical protein
MPADVAVLSIYALLLLALAHGLVAIGRRSTSPWASRTLHGHLRATDQAPEQAPLQDWPHSEVPRLYAAMGLVAGLAASALSLAGLLLHHDAAAVAILTTVLALACATALRMAVVLRG